MSSNEKLSKTKEFLTNVGIAALMATVHTYVATKVHEKIRQNKSKIRVKFIDKDEKNK